MSSGVLELDFIEELRLRRWAGRIMCLPLSGSSPGTLWCTRRWKRKTSKLTSLRSAPTVGTVDLASRPPRTRAGMATTVLPRVLSVPSGRMPAMNRHKG